MCIYTGDDDSWLKKDDVLVVILPNGRVESRIHWFKVPGICRAWNGNIGYGECDGGTERRNHLVAVGQDVGICLQPTAHSIARSLGKERMLEKNSLVIHYHDRNEKQLYCTFKTSEVTLFRGYSHRVYYTQLPII